MPDFFRKERSEVFVTRFSPPTATQNAWTLKTNLVFQAKAFGKSPKVRVVKVANKSISVKCWAENNTILYLTSPFKGLPGKITEARMREVLAYKKEQQDTLLYQVAALLCKIHATSSANSLMISGCVVNNFEASKTYAGEKLHLVLKSRTPFTNPFVSGLEKEYFLIGQVVAADCERIEYFGSTNEEKNELVSLASSQVPQPPGSV